MSTTADAPPSHPPPPPPPQKKDVLLEHPSYGDGEMSVDHSVIKSRGQDPVFLRVKSSDIVLVWDHPELIDSDFNAWWMGEVIFVEGSARDLKAPSLFQIADIDTGGVRWCNADCVQIVLRPLNML